MANEVKGIDPEGLGFVLDLVAAQHDHTNNIMESVQKSIEQERDEWKDRALKAESKLFRAQNRLNDLIFGDKYYDESEPFSWDD